MATPYTHTSLNEVKDSAPEFGFEEYQEARFAQSDLDAERTGFSLHRFKPGKRQGFAHRHDRAEEVYVVIAGSGRMKLDDEIVELSRLDAVRVAPGVTRQFEAGGEGLEVLAFGAHHDDDRGELIPGWWDDAERRIEHPGGAQRVTRRISLAGEPEVPGVLLVVADLLQLAELARLAEGRLDVRLLDPELGGEVAARELLLAQRLRRLDDLGRGECFAHLHPALLSISCPAAP